MSSLCPLFTGSFHQQINGLSNPLISIFSMNFRTSRNKNTTDPSGSENRSRHIPLFAKQQCGRDQGQDSTDLRVSSGRRVVRAGRRGTHSTSSGPVVRPRDGAEPQRRLREAHGKAAEATVRRLRLRLQQRQR